MAETSRLTVGFQDNEGLRVVCGERDSNLRWLESRLGIRVLPRGMELHLHGGQDEVAVAAEVLTALLAKVRAGDSVDTDDLSQIMAMRSALGPQGNPQRPRPLMRAVTEPELGQGTRAVSPRTQGQQRYVQAIRDHDIVLGVGPAGSGKTYLAMASAVAAMQRREVKRIVLTRPALEAAGERLGFLPGDLSEKISPYLRPLFDALRDLVDEDKFARMMDRGQIEVAPLAFMRGRTLSNAFVILDEAQNCTPEQMMMLLTRMGDHAKIVVNGDPTQSDLPRGMRNGLQHAVSVLSGIEGIGIVQMDVQDVVRHPLVGRIIEAYAADRQAAVARQPL